MLSLDSISTVISISIQGDGAATSREGVDVDAEDGGEFLVAAMLGHEAVVRLLLENGADINTDNKDGEKALLMAARLGHEEVVRLLLEKVLRPAYPCVGKQLAPASHDTSVQLKKCLCSVLVATS